MAENKRFNFYDNVFKYMETGIMDNGDKLNGETVCDLLNELAEEKEQLKQENKELKEKLDDILELTELTGMIHLRKAEIKSIINR